MENQKKSSWEETELEVESVCVLQQKFNTPVFPDVRMFLFPFFFDHNVWFNFLEEWGKKEDILELQIEPDKNHKQENISLKIDKRETYFLHHYRTME